MNSRLFVRIITLVVVCLGLSTGCTTLKPQAQWQAGDMPLRQVKNSLVLVLFGDALYRKKYEAQWVLALRKEGIKAGPSYAVFDDIDLINGESLAPFESSHQVDTLLVASVSLNHDEASPFTQDLSAYLKHQLSLGADVFIQQVEQVSVHVSAFSIGDGALAWQTVYQVPVIGQGFDWHAIVPSAVSLLKKAGLSPPPKPNKNNGKETNVTGKNGN